MAAPCVTVDLGVIERNARAVTAACARHGVSVFGVTKGTCGMPQVARAMLRGGVIGIGESRLENIRRLRAAGISDPVLLLRSPPPDLADETVRLADLSLNSELETIEALSRAAERRSRVHEVILMVDLGDLREGVWPPELMPAVARIVVWPGVRLVGLGTNLTCFGAVLPSAENMGRLAGYARRVRAEFGLELPHVTGGNSSSLPFLLAGGMPPGITNLRLGETILQGGRDTFFDEPWDELDRSAFTLEADLLEVKVKPSVPIGETGVDAFGGRPVFPDRGDRLRGILNVGREDVDVAVLHPVEAGVEVLGASSDHMIVDVTEMAPPPSVGDTLRFRLGYGALLAAMTSEYVRKVPMFDQPPPRPRSIALDVDPGLAAAAVAAKAAARIAALNLAPSPGGMPARLTEHPSARLVADTGGDSLGLVWLTADAGLLARLLELRPRLAPENIAVVGLREASDLVRGTPLSVATIVDVDARGIRDVMRRALDAATAGTRGYLLLCEAGVHTPGKGLSEREAHQATEAVAARPGLLGLEFTGLTPTAVPFACDLLMSALGRTIL
ncbi:putative amino acid racemase [Actinocorallia herbida]|uniref:Putative amino acid racemase n=1 Tax=Actinocorallia herbida TaxID=58109 RepID=A0A3N1D014_9ACTN|nr:alanine racemase [Actinocorallia herbida]ROO86871.1 putative amino acid racemase [Actinocorallia herbida]